MNYSYTDKHLEMLNQQIAEMAVEGQQTLILNLHELAKALVSIANEQQAEELSKYLNQMALSKFTELEWKSAIVNALHKDDEIPF